MSKCATECMVNYDRLVASYWDMYDRFVADSDFDMALKALRELSSVLGYANYCSSTGSSTGLGEAINELCR